MSRGTLPDRADTVIVGAGIMGLSIAYNLARQGARNIVVLERDYLCGGASGRNGGGIRAQWSSETNIRLMKESIKRCEDFATEMRINVWFRESGYLFLARTDAMAKTLSASVELQREHGLSTEILDRKAIARLVPGIATQDLVCASYNPDDGVVFPWPFVWGYARECQRLGVAVHTHTEVTDLETENGRISGVVTDRGRIRTERVVCAAGAWSPEVTKMVGVELPSHPHRHEICSTEPLKPFLKPLIADLQSGLYFSQSMRGEIVGGITNHRVPEGLDQRSSLRFLGLYSRGLVQTLPQLGDVRVLRQWSGCYDVTPDGNPLVGEVDECEGLYLTSGFMGHGFMMAPIMGEYLSGYLLRGEHSALMERWNVRRYREGNLLSETMILG